MIPNPILFNNNMITATLIVCCLIVLAIVMIPKAIRYRKQMREKENMIPNQQNQEIEMEIVDTGKRAKQNNKQLNYRKVFLSVPKITDRRTVSISNELKRQIAIIVCRFGEEKSSVSGFIENMVIHHLEEYKDEINRLYKE